MDEDTTDAALHQQEQEERAQAALAIRLTFDEWATLALAVRNHIDELLLHANERPGGFWAERLRYAHAAHAALDRAVRA